MRWSGTFIPTLRELPSEAESASHRLMLRAGLIRRTASGLYSLLPLGLRAVRKVENIVREEMNRRGAIELLMPILQPRELWEESGRWDSRELAMLTVRSRQGAEFTLGPTHEEVITDLVRRELRSYRDLPRNYYQIQAKFRDEVRPRFGLMRAREFIMKDAYSFDQDSDGSCRSYDAMLEAYQEIFRRCGLKFEAVEADVGAMGGISSHEFMALAEIGEDIVVCCRSCHYAANRELAERGSPDASGDKGDMKSVEPIDTPGATTIEDLVKLLGEDPQRMVKTLIYEAEGKTFAALVTGDRDVSEPKLRRCLGVGALALASENTIRAVTGGPLGFSGPVGLKRVDRMVADFNVRDRLNQVTGANEKDKHLRNVNIGRDYRPDDVCDISLVMEGDKCPRCGSGLALIRGIEVGQVFNLGTYYSKSLGATFLDKAGKEQPAVMGCYGIGITRTLAAVVEQNHDDNGIIWPREVAPFHVEVLSTEPGEGEAGRVALGIYDELVGKGLEVLLDDRDRTAGEKFKDADLLGLPLRVTVGPRGLAKGQVEVVVRRTGEMRAFPIGGAVGGVVELLAAQ